MLISLHYSFANRPGQPPVKREWWHLSGLSGSHSVVKTKPASSSLRLSAWTLSKRSFSKKRSFLVVPRLRWERQPYSPDLVSLIKTFFISCLLVALCLLCTPYDNGNKYKSCFCFYMRNVVSGRFTAHFHYRTIY